MKRIFLTAALALLGLSSATAQDIIAIEYAIDTDNGFGNNNLINVTPAQDGTFDFTANTTGLSKGYHTLYFRTLDSDGEWSHTSNRMIEILDEPTLNVVENLEVFSNTLGDFGTGIPFVLNNPAADGSFVINFPYTEVYAGPMIMYARAQDSRGHWSFHVDKGFTIVKQDDPPNNIKELNGNSLNIYPNPAKDVLHIVLGSTPVNNMSLTLVDITGKELYSTSMISNKHSIPLNQIIGGNYFLILKSGEKMITEKITILK